MDAGSVMFWMLFTVPAVQVYLSIIERRGFKTW